MSAEKFSGKGNHQRNRSEKLAMFGKKLAASAIIGTSLMAGSGLEAASVAEASPTISTITHRDIDSGGTEVVIVGGTGDPTSQKMPGYQKFVPDGVDAEHPTRVSYAANVLTYDTSEREGATRVRDAIEGAPASTRFIIIGDSQGAHAAQDGAELAVDDQPYRAGKIEEELFAAPQEPGGIFDYARSNSAILAIVGMAGVTVPHAYSGVPGVIINFHCIESDTDTRGRNDSICHSEGDLVKVGTDYNDTHGIDWPDQF